MEEEKITILDDGTVQIEKTSDPVIKLKDDYRIELELRLSQLIEARDSYTPLIQDVEQRIAELDK